MFHNIYIYTQYLKTHNIYIYYIKAELWAGDPIRPNNNVHQYYNVC